MAELEEYRTKKNAEVKTLLREIAINKNKIIEIVDFIIDDEQADLEADESAIANCDPELFLDMGRKFLKETEEAIDNLMEEIETIQTSIKNLQNEKRFLLEKSQDLEEKYEDLRTRHDAKTDMVGKLSVKVFILMTEIEKLSKEK